MGRRTLVLVAREDGYFDCRAAHWGVDADPFEQSRPLGSRWSATTVWESIDATFDQVVVCDGLIRRYCVCWLDPTLTDPEDVALARTDDLPDLRDWWVDAKSRSCAALAHGVDAGPVRAGLLAALRERADAVYLPDDAHFLRDDR